jgi:hypothetical protein
MNPASWLEVLELLAKHTFFAVSGVNVKVPRQCVNTPRRGSQNEWLRDALYRAWLAHAMPKQLMCISRTAQFKRFGSRSKMKHHRGFEHGIQFLFSKGQLERGQA